MDLGEQDVKGGQDEWKAGAEMQHDCTVQYPLLVMERGGSAKTAGGGLFIRFLSGRGDTSANGNPTHVCVRHLRVNGAGWAQWAHVVVACQSNLPFSGLGPWAHGA